MFDYGDNKKKTIQFITLSLSFSLRRSSTRSTTCSLGGVRKRSRGIPRSMSCFHKISIKSASWNENKMKTLRLDYLRSHHNLSQAFVLIKIPINFLGFDVEHKRTRLLDRFFKTDSFLAKSKKKTECIMSYMTNSKQATWHTIICTTLPLDMSSTILPIHLAHGQWPLIFYSKP